MIDEVAGLPHLAVGQRELLFHMPAGTFRPKKDVLLFISYWTIVGIQVGDADPVFTDFWQKSRTTTLHKSKWMQRFGGTIIPAYRFNRLVEQHGFDAGFQKAPVNFS